MNETEAIRRCLQGEKEPFAVIVRLYQAPVLALCLRMTGSREDAADIAQQAFTQAFRHLDRYDPDQPFRPWLYRIATNACIAFLRKRKPVETGGDLDEQLSDPAADTPTLAGLAEEREAVRVAVGQLPLPYRQVVVAYYFQELSYQEIARQTGQPIGTIGTLLFRAKQQLRRLLAEREVRT